MVTILLEGGADIEAENENGRTPLHCAAFGGECNTAKVLVDRGANALAKDLDHRTPVDDAKDSLTRASLRRSITGRTKQQARGRRWPGPELQGSGVP